MPFLLTIKLLNGDELTYNVQPRNGRGLWKTHHPRLEKMVYQHLDLTWNEYNIKFIFGDEEERLTEIVRRRRPLATEEEVALQVSEAMAAVHDTHVTGTLFLERYITSHTTIYALAQKRDKTMDQLRQEREEQRLLFLQEQREEDERIRLHEEQEREDYLQLLREEAEQILQQPRHQ